MKNGWFEVRWDADICAKRFDDLQAARHFARELIVADEDEVHIVQIVRKEP